MKIRASKTFKPTWKKIQKQTFIINFAVPISLQLK